MSERLDKAKAALEDCRDLRPMDPQYALNVEVARVQATIAQAEATEQMADALDRLCEQIRSVTDFPLRVEAHPAFR